MKVVINNDYGTNLNDRIIIKKLYKFKLLNKSTFLKEEDCKFISVPYKNLTKLQHMF